MKRTPKKLLATLLALAMLASLCVVPAAAVGAEKSDPSWIANSSSIFFSPSQDSAKYTLFFANGTPIVVSDRTDGVEGAKISWNAKNGEAKSVDVPARTIIFGGGYGADTGTGDLTVENAAELNQSGKTFAKSDITLNGGNVYIVAGGGLYNNKVEEVKIVANAGSVVGANGISGGGADSGYYPDGSAHAMVSIATDTYAAVGNVDIEVNGGTYGRVVGGGTNGLTWTDSAVVTVNDGKMNGSWGVCATGTNGHVGSATVNMFGGETTLLMPVGNNKDWGELEVTINVTGGRIDKMLTVTDDHNTKVKSITTRVTGAEITEIADYESKWISDEDGKKLEFTGDLDIRVASGVAANEAAYLADGKYAGICPVQIGKEIYPTLADAVAAAKAGDTVMLLVNLSQAAPVTVDKAITLDLNGKTITTTGDGFAAVISADCTVKNGSIAGVKGLKFAGGVSNVESVEIAVSQRGIGIYGGANVTVAADTVVHSTAEVAISVMNPGSQLDMYGKAVTDTEYGCIEGNGTDANKNTVINLYKGASLISEAGCAIYHPQAGTLSIDGAVIKGATGVQLCSGEAVIATVSGDTVITATGEDERADKTADGRILDGAALSIINRGYPGGEPKVTISGGTFTAENNDAVLAYTWSADTASEWADAAANVTISGGTFSHDPAAYVAMPFTVVSKDGNYIVELAQYEVTCHLNYGKDDMTYGVYTVRHGQTVARPTDPSRDMYKFVGWYDAAEGGSAWDFSQPVTADMDLYAHWTEDFWMVTLHHQDGKTADKDIYAVRGTPAANPGDPSREGYTFDGWYTEDTYKNKWNFSDKVTGDMDLYAKWVEIIPEPVTYTVTFDSRGGSAVAPLADVADGAKITAPEAPTRSGYNFGGWYKDEACTSAWDFDSDTVSADITLYAKWTEKSNSGGGGGGGGTTPTPPPTVETNPDGSTTKTETAKDGTVTETTEHKDGTVQVVETKPDGTVTESVKTPDGLEAKAVTSPEGKVEAEVVIPAAKAEAGTVELPISELPVTKDAEKAPVVTVKSGKPVTVAVPVAQAAPGMVAVIVNADGTEEIVTKSVLVDGALVVPLEAGATVKLVDKSVDFADAAQAAWAGDAIAFVSSHELFQGTGEGSFSPNQPMNRAMLVTVLHRLESKPQAGVAAQFADVAQGAYYTEAVAWASESGIVTGTGAGFDPDAPISREQLATILYRYMAKQGVQAEQGDLSAFADGGAVSPWAQEAMGYAVGAGLMTGKEGGVLDPQGTATRAEVAVVLQRLVEAMAQ